MAVVWPDNCSADAGCCGGEKHLWETLAFALRLWAPPSCRKSVVGLGIHSQGRVRMTGKMGHAGWGRANNLRVSGCHSYPEGNGLTSDGPSVVLLPSMAMTVVGMWAGAGWKSWLSGQTKRLQNYGTPWQPAEQWFTWCAHLGWWRKVYCKAGL